MSNYCQLDSDTIGFVLPPASILSILCNARCMGPSVGSGVEISGFTVELASESDDQLTVPLVRTKNLRLENAPPPKKGLSDEFLSTSPSDLYAGLVARSKGQPRARCGPAEKNAVVALTSASASWEHMSVFHPSQVQGLITAPGAGSISQSIESVLWQKKGYGGALFMAYSDGSGSVSNEKSIVYMEGHVTKGTTSTAESLCFYHVAWVKEPKADADNTKKPRQLKTILGPTVSGPNMKSLTARRYSAAPALWRSTGVLPVKSQSCIMLAAMAGSNEGATLCNVLAALQTLKSNKTASVVLGAPTCSRSICTQGLVRAARQEFPSLNINLLQYENVVSLMNFTVDGDAKERKMMNRTRFSPTLISKPAIGKLVSSPPQCSMASTISGGLGAIGLVLARWLVGHGTPDVMLLSQSGRPQSEHLAWLMGSKSKVTSFSFDISHLDSAAKFAHVAKSARGNTESLFHLAGIVAPVKGSNMRRPAIERVFHPKVNGAEHLIMSLGAPEHGECRLFSAASALFGPEQVACAVAHASLERLATLSWQRGYAVHCLQWPDDGLAPPQATSGLEAFGKMRNAEFINIMATVIHDAAVAVAAPSWAIKFEPPKPKLKKEPPKMTGAVSAAQPAAQGSAMCRDVLDNEVRTLLSSLLGDQSSGMTEETALGDIGLDSLASVEFRKTLSSKVCVTLPATFTFDHPTIRDILEHLSPSTPTPTSTTPHTATATDNTIIQRIPIQSAACTIVAAATRVVDASYEALLPMTMRGVDTITQISVDPGIGELAGTEMSVHGSFLEEFEVAAVFGISSAEASVMSPQQKIMMQVGQEAIEAAGQTMQSIRDTQAGVYVGCGAHGFSLKEGAEVSSAAEAFIASGASTALVANRLSFFFKIKGPSLALDTACSSALVALDVAVSNLRLSTCSAALCGAVQVSDSKATVVMQLAHELSSIGRCASFDTAADGFARGEGSGAIWLTMNPTEAEMETSIGSLPGIATQHNGRSVSLTAPSGNSQQTVLRAALSDSGLVEQDITVVECHGTGTSLGDPIEVGALRRVFGRSETAAPLLLGTVKTNVAHTEGASGMVGLIKSVLKMKQSFVTPNLHLRQINDAFATAKDVFFPTEPGSLSKTEKAISGFVSAFGLGGCNAIGVLQVSPTDGTSQKKGASDSKLKQASSLKVVTWVEETDSLHRQKLAYVSQVMLGSENKVQCVHVRGGADGFKSIGLTNAARTENLLMIHFSGKQQAESSQVSRISNAVSTQALSKIVLVSELSADCGHLKASLSSPLLHAHAYDSSEPKKLTSLLVPPGTSSSVALECALTEALTPTV
eukprot:gnl/MRDRNA2_/MRDRNA2_85929_c0_seq1.p1 gnl/MRDRNA2_/MRDRNA2_85929_c0~~gnl/MRDRNA2_/MRDRNA2_85929_c0_seq1.p1  ORF type:complete len:1316 (+),score=152.61 gnl/MRDRNA2_/MRDRNA2_85929_c0_seq1:4411-8358(+)